MNFKIQDGKAVAVVPNYTAPKFKTVKTEHANGSVSWNHRVPDGWHVGTATLTVDLGALLRDLGPRAIASKRGVSKYRAGAIVVKITNRRDEK